VNGMANGRELFPARSDWRETPLVSVPLDDKIDFYNPLTITWYYGPTVNGPWYEAGVSQNQLYVTLGTPQTAPLYHTLVHLGCENAKGETTEAGAVTKIWQEFTDQKVVTVPPMHVLTYWLNDQQGATNTAGLLGPTNGYNGNCQAWSSFLIDLLKAQNIPASQVEVKPQAIGENLLIKEWRFEGEGVAPGKTPYVYIKDIDVTLIDAMDGQGNGDPYPHFNVHYLVRYVEQLYNPSSGQLEEIVKYYDPSYGTGPFYSQNQFENASLAGFSIQFINEKGIYYVRKNISDIEETTFQ